MVKSLGKRSLAALLIICLLLSLLPATHAQAANVYPVQELKEGQVLNAGDQIEKGTNWILGSYSYYDAQGNYIHRTSYPQSPYTVEEVEGINSWKISYISDNDDERWRDVSLIPNTVAEKYTVTVNQPGLVTQFSYEAGAEVHISAATHQGYEFAGWVTDSSDIQFADKNAPETTFTMPAHDVEVTAKFRESEYTVTVKGGTTPQEKYKSGASVSIKADAPEDGCEFDKWTSDGPDISFDDPTSPETTFAMPAQAVTVTANFRKIPEPEAYKVSVMDGKADKATYKEGELVTVTAIERDGAKFAGWVTLDKEIVFKDVKATTTTFVMPGHDTSVTATYQPLVEPYKITAGAGGSHQAGGGKDMVFACSGALEDLTGILVDGQLVDASHYHLRSGSTILTLKASYLDTLSVGTHTLRFEYKTQSVETSFKITAKADPVKPADPSNKAQNPGTGLTTGTVETGAFSFIGLSVLLLGTLFINRKVRNKQ